MAGSVEEITLWLSRSNRTVEAARALAAGGFYQESVSRAYYAMFYAAKAAAVSEGIRASKHSAVVAAFGQLFASTGRLPKHLHAALMAAFRDRQLADYNPSWEPTRQDVDARLAQAEEFVAAVASVLNLEV